MVNQYLLNRVPGLERLKEMLPVLFQFHRIYVTARQRAILSQCNLDPIVEQGVGVTFNLPLETLKMRALHPSDSPTEAHPQAARRLKLPEEMGNPKRFSQKLARSNKTHRP